MPAAKHFAPALLGIALGLSAGSGLAQTMSHQDHGASELALSLNAGGKWQGDANMYQGMDAIRSALASQLVEIHENRLPAADYQALAFEIMNQTDFMIENCVLAPQVDEQFHVVLGQLIGGALDMETGDERRAGAVMIIQALNAYGEYFDHPGWQPFD